MRLVGGGRRRTLTGGIAGVVVLAALMLGYARFVEPRRLRVRSFRVGVADLPTAFAGLKVAHLTDFHVGMIGTHRATLRRAIRLAVDWEPDLVALTGDFVHRGQWEPEAALFADLAAAAPCYGVLGNHDLVSSPEAANRIATALRAQGVDVLRNEHRFLRVENGSRLVVVAVEDPSLGRDDISAAMTGLTAERDPNEPAILLGHAPEIGDRAPAGRFALVLTGHTHGGQLRFSPFKRRTPLELPMIAGGLDSPYARGSHVVRGNPLYVNAGLGVSGIPFRFLSPPEVAFFTLEPGIDEERDAGDDGRYFDKG